MVVLVRGVLWHTARLCQPLELRKLSFFTCLFSFLNPGSTASSKKKEINDKSEYNSGLSLRAGSWLRKIATSVFDLPTFQEKSGLHLSLYFSLYSTIVRQTCHRVFNPQSTYPPLPPEQGCDIINNRSFIEILSKRQLISYDYFPKKFLEMFKVGKQNPVH